VDRYIDGPNRYKYVRVFFLPPLTRDAMERDDSATTEDLRALLANVPVDAVIQYRDKVRIRQFYLIR
jgi:hypothetical protein